MNKMSKIFPCDYLLWVHVFRWGVCLNLPPIYIELLVLLSCCKSSSFILEKKSLIYLTTIFFSFDLTFHFHYDVFWTVNFLFLKSNFYGVSFLYFCVLRNLCQRNITKISPKTEISFVFFQSFIVWRLTFKPIIHYKLIFIKRCNTRNNVFDSFITLYMIKNSSNTFIEIIIWLLFIFNCLALLFWNINRPISVGLFLDSFF